MIRRALTALALALGLVALTALPASAGATSHTWHSCQHSAGNYGSSALTSAQTYKYCYVIGVRVVVRTAGGSTSTNAWNTSTSSAQRNVYAYPTAGTTMIKSHHFVQDHFGVREYHTCYPSSGCVGGIA